MLSVCRKLAAETVQTLPSSFLKDMQVFHYKEGPEIHMKAAVNKEGAIPASMVHCYNTKRVCGSVCVFVRVYACRTRRDCHQQRG